MLKGQEKEYLCLRSGEVEGGLGKSLWRKGMRNGANIC